VNYQGKNKLFLSIGTTLLIVVALIVIFAATPDARPALLTLSGAIVLMSLISVAFAYLQYGRAKERVSKLPEDYQAAYLNIHELLGTYGMSKLDRQTILSMVIEIFEHAHLDGRAVDDVVGSNPADFVDSFANETGRSPTPGYLFGYATSLFLEFLLLIKAYKVIRTGSITLAALKSETLDVGIVATYLIIAYVFAPWLLLTVRRSARRQWRGIKKLKILIPMLIPLGLMMALIMIDNQAWRAVLDSPVAIFTSPLSLVLGFLLLAATIVFTRLNRRK
jgi:DNA-binding ferritin-like protein (Dps family)